MTYLFLSLLFGVLMLVTLKAFRLNTNGRTYKVISSSSCYGMSKRLHRAQFMSTSPSVDTYNFSEIEKKWQNKWESSKLFAAKRREGYPKKYVLDMFPYPSGSGLHVGHPEGYTATDIMSRYWRMKGFDVLHPMGWDAFGLPAEQHAINTGTHPAVTTDKNIATFNQSSTQVLPIT